MLQPVDGIWLPTLEARGFTCVVYVVDGPQLVREPEQASGTPTPPAEPAGPAQVEVALPPRSDVRAEFDRICGQVQAAPSLPSDRIQGLIGESSALADRLADSELPQAKILLKRLEMCREFFEYTLELRLSPPEL